AARTIYSDRRDHRRDSVFKYEDPHCGGAIEKWGTERVRVGQTGGLVGRKRLPDLEREQCPDQSRVFIQWLAGPVCQFGQTEIWGADHDSCIRAEIQLSNARE